MVPLLAGAILVPLVRPTFLWFLDQDPGTWGEGMHQVVFRAAVVVVGWLSLDVYGALIRGPGRDVLAVLPIDAAAVARAELIQVAASRWWLIPGAALVLSPVAVAGAPGLWAAAVLVVAGCFALGLTGSALAHLLAIRVAEDPRFAGLLDLVRGNNPRPQAAFLYAPGVVLVACGGLLGAASAAVPGVVAGDPKAVLFALSPFVGAALAWLPVPALAKRTWFRGSVVLSEIDARYATLVDPTEAARVYLDWVVRYLPAGWRPYALNDLRHGWRARRTLISLAWLVGLVALGAGWTDAASGPARAAAVAVMGVFLVAGNGVLLARDEPAFLRVWLPTGGVSAVAARGVVLAAWTAPPVALATAAALFRHGWDAAGEVVGLGSVALTVAATLALACGRLRERGPAVYAPSAAVLAAVFLAWSTAGMT